MTRPATSECQELPCAKKPLRSRLRIGFGDIFLVIAITGIAIMAGIEALVAALAHRSVWHTLHHTSFGYYMLFFTAGIFESIDAVFCRKGKHQSIRIVIALCCYGAAVTSAMLFTFNR